MSDSRIAELIARSLSGEATPAESEELQHLREQSPEDEQFLEALSDYWNTPVPVAVSEEFHSDAHFQHLLESARPSPLRMWKMAGIAAILCGLIAGSIFFWYIGTKPKSTSVTGLNSEVTVRPGAKSRLLLPDGTTVWLNSDSKLTYNSAFNGRLREVELEGEAFFDVIQNPERPFIVHASGLDIRVLGTAFNVKAYPRETTFETTLIRGKVEVAKQNEPGGQKIVLHPHEKLILRKDADPGSGHAPNTPVPRSATAIAGAASDMALKVLPVNLPDTSVVETAWVYNKLVFDGESFKEIAARMERWFNVKIRFRDSQIADYRFHATFENEKIEDVLRSLQVIQSFEYTINNNEVTIYK